MDYVSVEFSVNRMMFSIDTIINKYYFFNEPGLIKIAISYVKKYLSISSEDPRSQLKILCTTCYLIAMKYHLDESPTLLDYSEIVNVSTSILVKKEIDLANKFMFNFTPKQV
jgi:hypothetical protein